jgi:predicted dehydrogenase
MSPLSPVKIAIIGTGHIGPRHADAVRNVHEADLTCVVDPDPAAGGGMQVPRYRSIPDMVASGDKPDAAIVCTPNHTHVTVSMELLDHGIHVLVEKPISTDSESGQLLVDHAARGSLHLLVGHHRRFNAQVRAAKNLLDSRRLGRVVAVQGTWALPKPRSYFEEPTVWKRSRAAGGPVLINLIHEVDILLYLNGPINRVYAEETLKQRGYEAEEGAAITFRHENGVVGAFVLSDAVTSPWALEAGTGENPVIPRSSQPFLKIMGSEGSFSLGDMKYWKQSNGGEPDWRQSMAEETIAEEEEGVPFELQVRHFINVIRNTEDPLCTGSDGLRAVMVCEAVKRSMETGLPVTVHDASLLERQKGKL